MVGKGISECQPGRGVRIVNRTHFSYAWCWTFVGFYVVIVRCPYVTRQIRHRHERELKN